MKINIKIISQIYLKIIKLNNKYQNKKMKNNQMDYNYIIKTKNINKIVNFFIFSKKIINNIIKYRNKLKST